MHVVIGDGKESYHAVRLEFKVTNNEVKVLASVAITRVLGGEEVEMKIDSQVVVGQITWEYLAKGSKLIKYLTKFRSRAKVSNTFESRRYHEETFPRLTDWRERP